MKANIINRPSIYQISPTERKTLILTWVNRKNDEGKGTVNKVVKDSPHPLWDKAYGLYYMFWAYSPGYYCNLQDKQRNAGNLRRPMALG